MSQITLLFANAIEQADALVDTITANTADLQQQLTAERMKSVSLQTQVDDLTAYSRKLHDQVAALSAENVELKAKLASLTPAPPATVIDPDLIALPHEGAADLEARLAAGRPVYLADGVTYHINRTIRCTNPEIRRTGTGDKPPVLCWDGPVPFGSNVAMIDISDAGDLVAGQIQGIRFDAPDAINHGILENSLVAVWVRKGFCVIEDIDSISAPAQYQGQTIPLGNVGRLIQLDLQADGCIVTDLKCCWSRGYHIWIEGNNHRIENCEFSPSVNQHNARGNGRKHVFNKCLFRDVNHSGAVWALTGDGWGFMECICYGEFCAGPTDQDTDPAHTMTNLTLSACTIFGSFRAYPGLHGAKLDHVDIAGRLAFYDPKNGFGRVVDRFAMIGGLVCCADNPPVVLNGPAYHVTFQGVSLPLPTKNGWKTFIQYLNGADPAQVTFQ